MSILFDNPPPAIGCGDPGDPIDFAMLFTGTEYFSITADGSDTSAPYALSGWIKQVNVSATQALIEGGHNNSSPYAVEQVNLNGSASNDKIHLRWSVGSETRGDITSPGVYRDVAGWFHLYIRRIGTAVIMAVNGEIVSTATFTDAVTRLNNSGGQLLYIGRQAPGTPATPALFYLADFALLTGDAAASSAPGDFGYQNSDNVWVPKLFAGKGLGSDYYGPYGFHLDFADPLDMGKDVSGNGHHLTPSGVTVANQVRDTPTNNCPTWNRLSASGTVTWRDGNRQVSSTGNPQNWNKIDTGTMLIPATGKWYWEWVNIGSSNNDNIVVGLLASWAKTRPSGNLFLGREAGGHGVFIINDANPGTPANWKSDGIDGAPLGTAITGTAGGVPSAAIGAAFDADNGLLEIFVSNVSRGVRNIPLSQAGQLLPAAGVYDGNLQLYTNPDDLTYAPPAGYKPLTSASLPCPAIMNPDDYFTVRLSSGGADITDLPWNPLVHKTLVVSKRRDTAASWRVSDTVRGNNLAWRCDVGGLEVASSLAFTPNGVAVGADTEYQGSRVDYFWRASLKAGFDIIEVNHVTGTPTTVTHQAGGLIDYAWLVPLDGGDVRVFHRSLPSGQYLRLNGGSVAGTDANWFTSTAVNLTIGASLPTGRYSLPVWRTVPQFSAFVAYPGNSLVDGAFCPLDFLPRMALIKTSQAPNPHYALDIDRAPGNPITNELQPGTNGVENTITIDAVDFVTNGLKQRSSTSENNTTPNSIIPVAAWAQTAGKFARAR